jgi:hypothetical protein
MTRPGSSPSGGLPTSRLPNDEWLQEFQEESGVDYFDQVSPQAAVVPSWEDRFGVRLVGIAFETLELSVAAPPVTFEHALHVAAEHWMFCPDNLEQGGRGLAGYAEQICGETSWTFWWD